VAQATDNYTTSRFHNLSNGALADALGYADACLKGAEAECKALKDEIKHRGLAELAGFSFAVTATEQISGRLDTKAVKEFLGETYHRFENATVSTVIRIRAVKPLAAAA
jgi:hypothetical protein